jgi:signal transduction histidine kinase
MFKTLRSKLILSYIAIAVLCLALALGVLGLLARDFAREAGFRSLDQKKSLATPYVELLVALELQSVKNPRVGLRPVLNRIAGNIRDAGLRVLLLDPATSEIREDTSLQFNATGERFPFDDSINDLEGRIVGDGVVAIGSLPGGDGRAYQYFATRPMITPPKLTSGMPTVAQLLELQPEAANEQTGGSGSSGGGSAAPEVAQQRVLSPYIVVIAQHQPQLGELFNEVGRYFLPAVLVALAVSFLAAYLLGRSVARPVQRLAAATEAMATGDYKQRVPVDGEDELAALSSGFNRMAEEVDRAHRMQRDFVANVSHELKTPLTSIQGFSQAMLDGAVKTQSDYRQAALIINQEAQRMNRLVGEILGLAKLQNGLQSLEMRPVELGPVLSQLILSMQPQAATAGVNLAARYEYSGDVVMADDDRLKQVFANLIENAVKYTPVGGTVTLVLSREGGSVLVQVRDTGRGMPEHELNRVTERFYQVDKARAAGESRSLGLGLSIAREIVAAHHGEMRIESTPGEGTTVSVLLPAQFANSSPQPGARTKALFRGRET